MNWFVQVRVQLMSGNGMAMFSQIGGIMSENSMLLDRHHLKFKLEMVCMLCELDSHPRILQLWLMGKLYYTLLNLIHLMNNVKFCKIINLLFCVIIAFYSGSLSVIFKFTHNVGLKKLNTEYTKHIHE